MRKLMIVSLLALSACAGGALSTDKINEIVLQVQAYTQQACAFAPTAATVATLVGAFVPEAIMVGSIVTAVGEAICKAPTTQSVRRRGTVQEVRAVRTPSGRIVNVKGSSLARSR